MRASLLLTSLVFSSVPYGFVRAPLRTYRKHPAAVDLLLADCRMAAIPLKTCFRVQSPSHTCRQHVPGGSASPATPCFRERHYDPNKALKARDWPQRECPGDLAAPRGTSASEQRLPFVNRPVGGNRHWAHATFQTSGSYRQPKMQEVPTKKFFAEPYCRHALPTVRRTCSASGVAPRDSRRRALILRSRCSITGYQS